MFWLRPWLQFWNVTCVLSRRSPPKQFWTATFLPSIKPATLGLAIFVGKRSRGKIPFTGICSRCICSKPGSVSFVWKFSSVKIDWDLICSAVYMESSKQTFRLFCRLVEPWTHEVWWTIFYTQVSVNKLRAWNYNWQVSILSWELWAKVISSSIYTSRNLSTFFSICLLIEIVNKSKRHEHRKPSANEFRCITEESVRSPSQPGHHQV